MGRKPTEKMCRTVDFIIYWLDELEEPDMESFELVWNFIADYLKKATAEKEELGGEKHYSRRRDMGSYPSSSSGSYSSSKPSREPYDRMVRRINEEQYQARCKENTHSWNSDNRVHGHSWNY
jgi:hypothetical protein